MARGLIAACVLLLAGLSCVFVRQPPAVPRVTAGLVLGVAKQRLAADWDDTTVTQVERAYCVSRYRVVLDPGFVLYIVADVMPARTGVATSTMVSFHCPSSQPTLHTHPPLVCIGGKCVWVPRDERAPCAPSSLDSHWLNHKVGVPFNVVQCGADGFAFYRPAAPARVDTIRPLR